MIKWAMLWHGFRPSLSTAAAGIRVLTMCQNHCWQEYKCVCTSGGSCSFEQMLGQPQGVEIFSLPGRFRLKILKNNPNFRVGTPLPWENTGYITLWYMVQGSEYKKIPLLVGGLFSKHGHHQILCLCKHIFAYDRFHWCYQCYTP